MRKHHCDGNVTVYYVCIADELEIKELLVTCVSMVEICACTITVDFIGVNVVVAYNFRCIILLCSFVTKYFHVGYPS